MWNVSSGLPVSVIRSFQSFGIFSKMMVCCFETRFVLSASSSLMASLGNILGMTPLLHQPGKKIKCFYSGCLLSRDLLSKSGSVKFDLCLMVWIFCPVRSLPKQ